MPVKPQQAATPPKSRLVAPPGTDHLALALAFALDTISAAAQAVGADRVYAVTAGGRARAAIAGLGVQLVDDPGGGLDAAVRHGVTVARREHPQAGVAVLLGDLPALRPAELVLALASAGRHRRAVVPDHTGNGTVLLTARADAPATGPAGLVVHPRFGPDSAQRHTAAGHTRLELDSPGLRSDVDDRQGLLAALALGVGPHTRAALAGPTRSPGDTGPG